MSLATRALIHEHQRVLWRGPTGHPHVRDAGGVVHVVSDLDYFNEMPRTACGRCVGFEFDWMALTQRRGPLGPEIVNTWDAVNCMTCLVSREPK